MPFNKYGSSVTLEVIASERLRDAEAVVQLERNKLKGRIRNEGGTARATPSGNSDVIAGDAEGDTLNDGTYKYELINVTGVGLRWHRVTMLIAW